MDYGLPLETLISFFQVIACVGAHYSHCFLLVCGAFAERDNLVFVSVITCKIPALFFATKVTKNLVIIELTQALMRDKVRLEAQCD